MTITLPPQVESRLRRKAARLGEDADLLAGSLLLHALADEDSEELRQEYRQLVTLELRDTLNDAQMAHLYQVTQKLDDFDRHSPAAQAMSERLEETGRKLDEMLAIIRTLPLAESAT